MRHNVFFEQHRRHLIGLCLDAAVRMCVQHDRGSKVSVTGEPEQITIYRHLNAWERHISIGEKEFLVVDTRTRFGFAHKISLVG